MNETKYTTKILASIKHQFPDWYIFKFVQTGFAKIGVPDLILCAKGKYVGIEIKKIGNYLSKQQEYNLNLIIKAGGKALVFWIDDTTKPTRFALAYIDTISNCWLDLEHTVSQLPDFINLT